DAASDVVTAARVLQWIAHPGEALERMVGRARPGGAVVALEYSHADIAWEPEPPAAGRRFYDAFLAARRARRREGTTGCAIVFRRSSPMPACYTWTRASRTRSRRETRRASPTP